MHHSRYFLSIFCIIVLLAAGSTVSAQTSDQETKAFINRTTNTLREAGKPLTMEQIQKMENLDAGTNFRNEVMNILTNEQKDSLRNSYRDNTRKRKDSDNRGDFRARFMEILKEAGHPMTDEQIKQLNALETGPETRTQMGNIFTEEQNKVLQEARQRGGQSDRRSASEFIGGALEKAGDPLTEDQKKTLDALERGPETRDQIIKILTDSQNKILEEQRGQRGGNR